MVALVSLRERVFHAYHHRDWIDTQQKVACSIASGESTTGHTKRMTSMRQYATAEHTHEIRKYWNLNDTCICSARLDPGLGVELLWPLPGTKSKNEFITVMAERHPNQTWKVYPSKSTTTHVKIVIPDQRITPGAISDHLLIANSSQIISRLFAMLRDLLGLKHLTKTAYHLQINGKAERYCQSIIARLWNHNAEHKRYWWLGYSRFPPSYACSTRVLRSTAVYQFRLIPSRHPPGAKNNLFSVPNFIGLIRLRIYPRTAKLHAS